ncbi:MAG: rRNA pseudouridine synthase [Chloroflexi bacterium]|nr:rRNA pseudouridine synthase [Chloroflexota bacterium]
MEKTLTKYLVEAYGLSRRQATKAIKDSQVIINGEIAQSFNMPVKEGNNISYRGQNTIISFRSQTFTLLMNKPKGILAATVDKREKTVLDILPPFYKDKGLFPAGRLDKESTGLIILTNDGDLAYKLTHPSFEHEKEYYVSTARPLTDAEKKQLEKGVDIYESGLTSPAKIKDLGTSAPPYHYSVIIHEGKKRQVRRMFLSVNNIVKDLKRVRIASLVLPDDLNEGQARMAPSGFIDSI